MFSNLRRAETFFLATYSFRVILMDVLHHFHFTDIFSLLFIHFLFISLSSECMLFIFFLLFQFPCLNDTPLSFARLIQV